jgi:putative SbcD/Mre11-related phosphoesterase
MDELGAKPWPGGLSWDPDRAAFHGPSRTLLVADLHLGFEWVQRARGHLIPLARPDHVPERLRALSERWGARRIVALGDVVHGDPRMEGVRSAVSALLRTLPGMEWHVVLGNHDRGLASVIEGLGIPGVTCGLEWGGDGLLGVHGDQCPRVEDGVVVVSGHEHPMVDVGRPGTGEVRVPAFVVGKRGVILPAFSPWAPGSVVGRRPMLGEWGRRLEVTCYVACMGRRLLEIPAGRLGRGSGGRGS